MAENTGEIDSTPIPELATRLRNAIAAAADATPSRESLTEILAVTEAVRDAAERILSTPVAHPAFRSRAASLLAIEPVVLDTDRLLRARERLEDEPTNAYSLVGTRIPNFLHQYVNAFVARSNQQQRRGRRSEVTKQEVIAEALCLFYAVHEMPPTGEVEGW